MQSAALFHIECLLTELSRRQLNNPRYSRRAYARSLGLDPSALCRILNQKLPLTPASCARILQRLRLSRDDQRRFVHSAARDLSNRLIHRLDRMISAENGAASAFDATVEGPGEGVRADDVAAPERRVAIYNFEPSFCASCGSASVHQNDPEGSFRFNLRNTFECPCGMLYQRAERASLILAAIESEGDLADQIRTRPIELREEQINGHAA